jgi:diadenosine tetraphosphate (Ap4A) HIT family hydrolase
MSEISEAVANARAGTNDTVICRMESGWVVIGNVQVLPGYCLLLPDPVVPSLNDLTTDDRITYLRDMARIGDALLEVTGAFRINYEILGNTVPELHTHIIPRYAYEPDERRRMPAWFYDWSTAKKYTADEHGALFLQLRRVLQAGT